MFEHKSNQFLAPGIEAASDAYTWAFYSSEIETLLWTWEEMTPIEEMLCLFYASHPRSQDTWSFYKRLVSSMIEYKGRLAFGGAYTAYDITSLIEKMRKHHTTIDAWRQEMKDAGIYL